MLSVNPKGVINYFKSSVFAEHIIDDLLSCISPDMFDTIKEYCRKQYQININKTEAGFIAEHLTSNTGRYLTTDQNVKQNFIVDHRILGVQGVHILEEEEKAFVKAGFTVENSYAYIDLSDVNYCIDLRKVSKETLISIINIYKGNLNEKDRSCG